MGDHSELRLLLELERPTLPVFLRAVSLQPDLQSKAFFEMFHEISGIMLDPTEYSVSIDGLVLLSSLSLKISQLARILSSFYHDNTIIHLKIFHTKNSASLPIGKIQSSSLVCDNSFLLFRSLPLTLVF